MSLWNQPSLPPHQRVRKLWDEFEKWAAGQRKNLHSQLADVQNAQSAKWKATPLKNRNQAQHDEATKKQLQEVAEHHTDMLMDEWQARVKKTGLSDDAWGKMSDEENRRIERVFYEEDNHRIASVSAAPNVYTQPQSAPAYNPPPMTSIARTVNLSASTSSSYKVIDPSSFSADDEDDGYDAEESYVASTDESGDEYFTLRTKAPSHGSDKSSPDLSLADFDEFEPIEASSSSSKPETSLEPQKRPPDTDRKGKGCAHGPVYVGPYLSSPEDSSDEDDFTLFKMQTRIDKIWEFHYAAVQADVQLVLSIANDRLSKEPFDEKARISEHERQMRQLQVDKEEERQAIVELERKKRREEIRKRPAGEQVGGRNTHSSNLQLQHNWESKFTESHPVHLDAEKKAFALGHPSPPQEEPRWGASVPEAWSEARSSKPSATFGTVRARRQSQTGATSSGWNTKHTPSPPTTTSAQIHATPSSADPAWYDRPETHGNSFDRDAAFSAQTSTPVPPIPAGWGEKPSATALLKKVLSDPPANRKHSLLSVESQAKLDHASAFTSAKKPAAKNIKGQHFSVPDQDSPTTPTVASNARPFPNKDILSRYSHVNGEDETSSTPRPQGFMKRSMAEYASDIGGSTPKIGRGLADMGMPTTAAWPMNGQSAHVRQQMPPQFDDDDAGWGQVNALAEKAMEAIAPQDDMQWGAIRHPQAMGPSHPQQTMRDEGAWGRGMHAASSRIPATKTSPSASEPLLWEHRTQSIAQPSAFSQRAQPPKTDIPNEDFWKAAKSQLQAEAAQPEETPWQRMQRLRTQGTLPGSDATPTFEHPPARSGLHSTKPSWSGQANFESAVADGPYQQHAAPSNQFWAPNGTTTNSQAWNTQPSTMKQSSAMPGGYTFDAPQGYDRFGQNSMHGKAQMSSSYPKHPTVEDEPDEDAPGGRYGQHESLPYNSRHVLDIAVPKPSHPPTAFSDVIDFDDEFDEGEFRDGLRSSVPTPSTAPTSPPMSDEEWMKTVAEKAKKGDFSLAADPSNQMMKPASAWSSGAPSKPSAWGAQKLDPEKLQSALKSVPTSGTTPPKVVPATITPPTAPAAPPAPAPEPASKEPAPVAPTKAASEKPEPAAKTGNQNQKGKKGKGKGKK